MVAAAVARAGGETTPAHVAETTHVSPIDLHHAVADMVKGNMCSIGDGTIRLLLPTAMLTTLADSIDSRYVHNI